MYENLRTPLPAIVMEIASYCPNECKFFAMNSIVIVFVIHRKTEESKPNCFLEKNN
jgi:hypothetical protein